MTKKADFIFRMRFGIEQSNDQKAIEVMERHIQNVLPMSEKQFDTYSRKLVDILKRHREDTFLRTQQVRDFVLNWKG